MVFESSAQISLKICFLVSPDIWLNRAERDAPHLRMRSGAYCRVSLFGALNKDCREGC